MDKDSIASRNFDINLVKKHYQENHENDFKDSDNFKETFRMILPPPNVTGNLHIGHALTVTIEDSFCRYNKFLKKKVIWYPGFDHAGIATQNIVEKKIFRDTGKYKRDISSDEFLKYCEEWKTNQINTISSQLRSLGTNLDWSKTFYTMDDKFSKVVSLAFCHFYNEGLIFRDKKTVNWCPILETTLSDQEVKIIDNKKICSRSGSEVIEIEKDQWFLNCKEIHTVVIKAIKNHEIKIKPKFVESTLIEWLSNLEPWCLSRQLLWGHKIPAYFDLDTKNWIVNESKEKAKERSFGGNIKQDSDVLDTWFSSSLIPLVVAGWPDNPVRAPVLEVLETGHDIIGFWVSRMLTLCKRLTNYFPFTNVVLHGLVLDSTGRKMSKSLGNVIDPLDIINGITLEQMINRLRNSNLDVYEIDNSIIDLKNKFPKGIPSCGVDVLRFVFLKYNLSALDINLNIVESLEEGRRFCNKLWNLSKYVQKIFKASFFTYKNNSYIKFSQVEDRWILSRLEITTLKYCKYMENFEPHSAFNVVRLFILNDLCNNYIEIIKNNLKNNNNNGQLCEISFLLCKVVGQSFHMLKIFMPFISNYLIDNLLYLSEFEIIIENTYRDILLESQMDLAFNIISTIRSLRNELSVSKNWEIKGFFLHNNYSELFCDNFGTIINNLTNFSLKKKKEIDSKKEKIFPYNVIGSSAILGIVFAEDKSYELIKIFNKQLLTAENRKHKFEQTRNSTNMLLNFKLKIDLKKSVDLREIAKLQKNIVNSERIIYGMDQEIEKLKMLLKVFNNY